MRANRRAPEAFVALVASIRSPSSLQDGITRASLRAFIKTLAIPAAEKKRLLALTPATYIGKASGAGEENLELCRQGREGRQETRGQERRVSQLNT